ncbi:MAG: DUF3299 domain-containing protein [Geminicoccaceae bacterium]
MKRFLVLLGRRARLVVVLSVLLVAGLAALGARMVTGDPPRTELTWEQLLPPSAKANGVGGALSGFVQHGQLQGLQSVRPQDVELVTEWVGDRVRLPGYVVPLDFDGSKVTGFLLVPYMGACIHVPPPPPNQIVYVHTKEPIEIDEIFEAVYATGRFEADLMSTGLAEVGYRIVDATVQPYEPPA